MSTPSYSATCPECGSHIFRMYVQQRVHVKFTGDGEHEVCGGPEGDMEFDDTTEAICNGCDYYGPLGLMK